MTHASDDLTMRCQAIELLVLDVDGVLTDGVIAIDDNGVETKHFHVRDGSAIALWRKAGKRVAILSGRSARCVDIRAAELGISPVIQGASDKGKPFLALLAELGLRSTQACYVGDDLADLPVMGVAGLAACPNDAAPEVRRSAHMITNRQGGRGAVREVIEKILDAQGIRSGLVAAFRTPA
ncbi:KdsC family phosphatase [Tundrisphaera sp. TA3]|uniref:KdsC family phosphatase n=1 Tax=Tundrisphaera sp. TA3 TaxID=3435775 RepID=UPI003EBC0987